MELSPADRALIGALQDGLAMEPRPFRAIAERLGRSEADLLDAVAALLARGVFKRFGLVVRHHELGYTANAMAVWDVPDDRAGKIGQHLARRAGVTLCYRRERQPPSWPYNLYVMVHGRDRAAVRDLIAAAIREEGLDAFPHALLFSARRFVQRGARYVEAAA